MVENKGYIKGLFDDMGFRPYSEDELRDTYQDLYAAVAIGMSRNGDPTMEDGGVKAIPTGVSSLSYEEWDSVPTQSTAIACSYGGTNWITAHTEKLKNGRLKIINKRTRSIGKAERTIEFRNFVGMMAAEIEGVSYPNNPNKVPIGISLGFAHRNISDSRGVEACLIPRGPSKNWDIQYSPNPVVGKELREQLPGRGVQVGKIFILNDTNAVANQINPHGDSKLPVGFVFGTGTNAALYDRNLEIGLARMGIGDSLSDTLPRPGHVTTTIENIIGGDNIRARVVTALKLLETDHRSSGLLPGDHEKDLSLIDGVMISRIAEGSCSCHELEQLFGFSITTNELQIWEETTRRALIQAGQLIGVVMAAVTSAAGYTNGPAQVPVEGSVYWNGYGVQDRAKDTLSMLSPHQELSFYPASGLLGMAQIALARGNK